MIGVGFAWASILSLPYALLSDSVPAEKMGVYMGIFNFFIVIPQLLAASVLGFLLQDASSAAQPVYALVIGGVEPVRRGAVRCCACAESGAAAGDLVNRAARFRCDSRTTSDGGRRWLSARLAVNRGAAGLSTSSFAGAAFVSWITVVSGGFAKLAVGNVVEADDRDVFGHAQAALVQRAHRADRDQVAGGEQSRRTAPRVRSSCAAAS